MFTSSSLILSVVIPLYSLKFSNVTAQGIESIRNENNSIKMKMIEQNFVSQCTQFVAGCFDYVT